MTVEMAPDARALAEADDESWAEAALPRLRADRSLFELRHVQGLGRVAALSRLLRREGQRVVLTSGSFDIIHEGHSMYLEAARDHGDFLFVGVDSDSKIRARKGPGRPAVPEQERLRMVAHQRGVGAVVLKEPSEEKWGLIRAVRPDTLIATAETYTQEEISSLEDGWCGHVEVLDRMATVSTSARLRLMQLESLGRARATLTQEVEVRLRGDLEEAVSRAVRDAMGAVVSGSFGGSA